MVSITYDISLLYVNTRKILFNHNCYNIKFVLGKQLLKVLGKKLNLIKILYYLKNNFILKNKYHF